MNTNRIRTPKLLSVAEVADRFEVCPKTVLRWIRAGKLHAQRFGRLVRVADEDATAFAAAHRI